MNKLFTKVTAGATTVSLAAAMLLTPMAAHAQTTVTGPNGGTVVSNPVGIATNPISQWIVLSSLFAPGALFGGLNGTTTATGPNGGTVTSTSGGIVNNPISQWIVLSSLFAPGFLGGTTVINPSTSSNGSNGSSSSMTPTPAQ